jgi:hypothetical protein
MIIGIMGTIFITLNNITSGITIGLNTFEIYYPVVAVTGLLNFINLKANNRGKKLGFIFWFFNIALFLVGVLFLRAVLLHSGKNMVNIIGSIIVIIALIFPGTLTLLVKELEGKISKLPKSSSTVSDTND